MGVLGILKGILYLLSGSVTARKWPFFEAVFSPTIADMSLLHRLSALLVVFISLTVCAQPPASKDKEEEDSKAKLRKPVPKVDDDVPADAPGIVPPPGVLVVAVHSLPE